MDKYCFNCMSKMDDEDKCSKCGASQSEYSAEPHQLAPGTMLNGRYMLGKVLGEGGFGITYVGIDTVLALKVAVKEFYMSGYVNRNCTASTTVSAGTGTHAQTFEKNREKFLDEARVLAKFSQEDGIVGIRDYFVENNTAYIVMDFISGETLREYLKKNRKISWDKAMSILSPVLRSMEVIHKQNIIHRDISPDNIMMVGEGKVKLLDFGAAREFSQDDARSLSVVLKPGYAPEEQYRSKGHQGPWTDVYAICAVIYRCITGKVPDDSMERMFEDKVASPRAEGAECTPAQSAVLMKGLSVRQKDRYQSITEFLADVKKAEADPENEFITGDEPVSKTVYAGKSSGNGDDKATVYVASSSESRDAGATVYEAPSAESRDEGATVYEAPSADDRDDNATVCEAPKIREKYPIPAGDGSEEVQEKYPEFSEPAPAKIREKYPEPAGTDNGEAAEKYPEPYESVPENAVCPSDSQTPPAVPDNVHMVKKTKPKKKLGKILIPIAAVVCIAFVIAIVKPNPTSPTNPTSIQSKNAGGTLPAALESCSFILNGETFSLPASFEQFEKAGWIPKDGSYLTEKLAPGKEDYIILTNGSGDISVTLKNRTLNTITQKECDITTVSMNKNNINVTKNTVSIPGYSKDTIFGGNMTEDDLLGMYSDKYDYENENNSEYYRFYSSADGQKVSTESGKIKAYTFHFSRDVLYTVTIKNNEAISDVQVLKEKPSYKELDDMLFEWKFDYYDLSFGCGVPLSYYLENGWTIEESPEYVKSGGTARVKLRYDTLTTMTLYIADPFDEAVISENCYVSSLNSYSIETTDKNRNDKWTLTLKTVDEKEICIKNEMSQSSITSVFSEAGIKYTLNGNTISVKLDNAGKAVLEIGFINDKAYKCNFNFEKKLMNMYDK